MSDDGEDNITSLEQRASGQVRPSLKERPGVVPRAAIMRRGAVPVWLRAPWSCPAVAAKAACQPGARRRLEGLVGEPVAGHAAGNAGAERRLLAAGLGRTQRPVDRGAGGNRRQSAWPCGARRLLPTRQSDFCPTSYGFRPGRRCHDAIAEIYHFAMHSYEWIVETDVEA